MENAAVTFDQVAGAYEAQLQRGVGLSGEGPDFFQHGRLDWMFEFLRKHGIQTLDSVVDFGCGVGNGTALLRKYAGANQTIGVDCSQESLAVASNRLGSEYFKWSEEGTEIAASSVDAIYSSGVFHHIEPEQRDAQLAKIAGWLKPGGRMFLFENNPLNPGTRWVMSRIPFDRDAICLTSGETSRRLAKAGLKVERKRFLFVFPRALRVMRACEPWLAALPIGAQYVVVARRP